MKHINTNFWMIVKAGGAYSYHLVLNDLQNTKAKNLNISYCYNLKATPSRGTSWPWHSFTLRATRSAWDITYLPFRTVPTDFPFWLLQNFNVVIYNYWNLKLHYLILAFIIVGMQCQILSTYKTPIFVYFLIKRLSESWFCIILEIF